MRATAVALLCLAGYSAVAMAMTGDFVANGPDWWITAIKDVGFPAIVAVFLLVRVDRSLNEMVNAFRDLTEEIRRGMERHLETNRHNYRRDDEHTD